MLAELAGKRIGFLGGDLRETYLIQGLLQKGAVINTLGEPPGRQLPVRISSCPEALIAENEVVMAPMSGTDEQGYIKATFSGQSVLLNRELLQHFRPGQLFLIGVAQNWLQEILDGLGIRFVQLAKREDVAILNAIPTAEGVIKLAIERTPYTLWKARCLITGLGRCGLALADRLLALGAEVYGATRSPENIAWGESHGVRMVSYEELAELLPEIDLVINTVPAMTFPEERLNLLKEGVLLLDIASSPGGVDFAAAERLGIEAELLPGLPGMIAPLTAANILLKIIPVIIKENLS